MSEATGIYVDGEMIIAEPLLPGFTMAVKDVFEVLQTTKKSAICALFIW